jgi:hypothetical protein
VRALATKSGLLQLYVAAHHEPQANGLEYDAIGIETNRNERPTSGHLLGVAAGPITTCRSNERMAERDRDESGRPRNARPRDAVGRLLAPGSEGVPRIPDDLELSPSESLAYAQDLLNRGLAFNAHEVLEAAWKNGPDNERPLWQGLAQLAVGITHVQRGNRDGATTLLRRGTGHLSEVEHPAPHLVDVDGLVGWAAALVDDLIAGAEVPPPRLRPALTKSQ